MRPTSDRAPFGIGRLQLTGCGRGKRSNGRMRGSHNRGDTSPLNSDGLALTGPCPNPIHFTPTHLTTSVARTPTWIAQSAGQPF